MATNKFPGQAETIERGPAILNLSNEALAVEVAVRPETMQKYAAGYQKAGDKLMLIIAACRRSVRAATLPTTPTSRRSPITCRPTTRRKPSRAT